MISLRSLALIAVIWLVIYAIRRLRAHPADTKPAPPRETSMARCNYCGTYLPESEALQRDAKWYCCADHREADHGN